MCTRQPSLFSLRLLPSVRRTAQQSRRFLNTFIQMLKSLSRSSLYLSCKHLKSPLLSDKGPHSYMKTRRYGCWFSRKAHLSCVFKCTLRQARCCFSVGNCLILDSMLLTDVERRVANPFAC